MSYLEIELLESQDISDVLDEKSKTYLLLDALAVERWAFVPLSPDSLEIPENKEFSDILKEQDSFIKLNWLWEDTEWNSHYRHGPCLVELDANSPLIEYYKNTLAQHEFGILIQSQHSTDNLIKHLQSILRVSIEGRGVVYFQLHTPKSLASLFDAFEAEKMQQLLGPIECLVWRQNTGKAHQWFSYHQTSDDIKPAQELGWFKITSDEMQSIDHDALLHFRKSLINDALYYREQGYFERQPTMHLQKQSDKDIRETVYRLLDEAERYQVTDIKLKQRWVELHLYYQDFVQKPDIQELLQDVEQHQNKRIKRVNYLITEALEKDTAGEAP
ncbi:DUF4123 domain-containing protein [Kangiella spongicola]|uniref:DUF4123 domain-containing protein n=1 Tax=Kangiella spongicola TaxID=796379 RepID=A0A318D3S4_9GAMM|nr:DUF4123 domain-containing protein [Kangiella spongicola]PXF63601.1 hypothetical protein DL796_00140 [Kangiella spongicola]